MGKSHQAGWVVPRGKSGTAITVGPSSTQLPTSRKSMPYRCIGLKSQMTKFEAREALAAEVIKQTGQNLGGRVLNDSSVTFGWFVRSRYLPLREANWKPETAKVKKIQIQRDLVEKFESVPLDGFDKFMLQTHINNLAAILSKDRVLQARSYLKSIFSEAVEQDFLLERSFTQGHDSEGPAQEGQDSTDVGLTPTGVGKSDGEGSRVADIGNDRRATAERVVRLALEIIRRQQTHDYRNRLQRPDSHMGQDG